MTKNKNTGTGSNRLRPTPEGKGIKEIKLPPGEEYEWTPNNTNFKNQKDAIKEQSSRRK